MSRQSFVAIDTVGGLLPPDVLSRIAAGDRTVPGLAPADFDLAAHETLRDAANRAWSRLVGLWSAFQTLRAADPHGQASAGDTRQRWLLPLFVELGYGRLPRAERADTTVDARPYPISHRWQHSPIHLLGTGTALDHAEPGVAGAARVSPHGLVQDFLNRKEPDLWGFLSNGLRLRVLRDHESLSRQAYVEFDLEAIFDGELFAEFVVLYLVCHESRVRPRVAEGVAPTPVARDDDDDDAGDDASAAPDEPRETVGACFLERWVSLAREEGVRALDHLRDGVQRAIETLASGLVAHRENERLRARLRAGDLDALDYYRQVLRLAYRLIFLFVAEDRGLLFDPAVADPAARARYDRHYATRPIRERALRRRGGPHGDLWQQLRLVMGALYDGQPMLALPALGSFLWAPDACPDVMTAECSNEDLLTALRHLCQVEDRGQRYPVNWRNIGADELGSIYESLLELEPDLNLEAGAFALRTVGGSERKTTGSYYTPTSLVQCLLDSALDPVLEAAARSRDPEAAILALEVCDPACGSGHFLVAAAHRIAHRLARVRSGDAEPSPDLVRHALRDVVSRCIFGVDINPMAVELCKVSLWLEAVDPGRPLSFLDAHIQCGNALLGATPALMSRGLPDDTFAVLEGDDRTIVSSLKRRNKEERAHHAEHTEQYAIDLGERARVYESLSRRVADIEAIGDDNPATLQRKEDAWRGLQGSLDVARRRFAADAWCAAFVWPKDRSEAGSAAITDARFRALERGHAPTEAERETVTRLAGEYQFFHWQLAFPQVFGEPEAPFDDDDTTGWPGGFDVVLGNPPWERIKLQEKEFFAGRHDGIANAKNAAERKRAIARLPEEDPALWREWCAALRRANGESLLVRSAGRNPLCGRGDINTYAIFAELNATIISARGRAGFIVPSGIATDATTQQYFRYLVESGRLASLFHFENEDRVFPGVHHAFRFVLLTLSGGAEPGDADLVFYARQVRDLADGDRHFSLTGREFALINPNTQTCPTFRWARDAEITKAIYRRVPVLWREGPEEVNPWGLTFRAMLHMANDSGLFRSEFQLRAEGYTRDTNIFERRSERMLPLYEAKMIHHFDHRFGTYASQTDAQARQGKLPEATTEQHADPAFASVPRYWVHESEVAQRLAGRWDRGWLLGWRDICRATDVRTVIASIIPRVATGDTFLLAFPDVELRLVPLLGANLQSYVLDYVARQKIGGTHLKYHVFKQLAVLTPERYRAQTPWSLAATNVNSLLPRVLELTYTAWDLEPFARDCGFDGPPFVWAEARRFLLRCELDAAFFHLYGIARDDVAYIMDTFPIVKRKDERDHGEYRTKRVILELFDAMQAAIDTSVPYQTRLDPPPAHPSLTHNANTRPETSEAALVVADGTPPSGADYPHTLIWAFLRANGDRMPRLELARAFSLLAQPDSLMRHARGSGTETARQWASRVNRDRFRPGAFRAALDELASRHGVAYAPDGSTVTTTEYTAPAEELGEWPMFEARLALAVVADMPADQMEKVDSQLSDEDGKAVMSQGA